MKLQLTTRSLFIMILFIVPFTNAQPGGIDNENVWLRADHGVLTLPSSNVISAIIDQSGNNTSTIIVGDPTLSLLNSSYFNYNPSIKFDGDLDHFVWNGITSGWNTGELFIVTRNEDANTAGVIREIYDFGANPLSESGHPASSGIYFDDFGSGLVNNFGNLATIIDPSSQYIHNSSRGASNYAFFLQGGLPFQSVMSFIPSQFPVVSKFGRGNNPANGSYHGQLGDLILYENELPFADRQVITTYLAIKYGITTRFVSFPGFSGGAFADYVSPANVTLWDSDADPDYHNGILGIGREDIEKLDQRQSHTVDDSYRIYVGSLSVSNKGNATGINANSTYLLIGSNQDSLSATHTANLEVPLPTVGCDLFSRLAKEWKVTNSDFTNDFNWDISLPSYANPGSVSAGNLRLMIDDDGDFSNGGTQCYYNGDGSGISISYSSPVITISGISNAQIPISSTRYMTVGSISGAVPLPVGLISFMCEETEEKNGVKLSWETSSEENNNYFDILKSTDGKTWESIDKVSGGGSSNALLKYSWVDKELESGIQYYRLKQVDFDGKFVYSPTCGTSVDIPSHELTVYPNPANNEIFVIADEENIDLVQVINISGKEVLNVSVEVAKSNLLRINLSDIAPGTYFIQVGSKIEKFNKF